MDQKDTKASAQVMVRISLLMNIVGGSLCFMLNCDWASWPYALVHIRKLELHVSKPIAWMLSLSTFIRAKFIVSVG